MSPPRPAPVSADSNAIEFIECSIALTIGMQSWSRKATDTYHSGLLKIAFFLDSILTARQDQYKQSGGASMLQIC